MGLFGAAHGLGWGEKLALGMALKFDASVGKGSKLKVRKSWGSLLCLKKLEGKDW